MSSLSVLPISFSGVVFAVLMWWIVRTLWWWAKFFVIAGAMALVIWIVAGWLK